MIDLLEASPVQRKYEKRAMTFEPAYFVSSMDADVVQVLDRRDPVITWAKATQNQPQNNFQP